MVTWPDALQRVAAGQPNDLNLTRKLFPGFDRTPLVITGSAGAGKTRIWGRLTGKDPARKLSMATDDGYMLRPNKRPMTLTTIPGQDDRGRYFAMEELFGQYTQVGGVIFVASNGYEHVWPKNAELVATNLRHYTVNALRQWNKRKELSNLRDVCRRIGQKHVLAPAELRPRWLLVVVNKLDLYMSEVEKAERYYLPGRVSPFNDVLGELQSGLGTSNISCHFLPVAVEASDYRFSSSRGTLSHPSTFQADQCSASMLCLVETLEALCGA